MFHGSEQYWTEQLALSGQILLSFILGALIGLEREIHHSPAGIRTYAAVCVGSCLFGIISTHAHGAAYYDSVVDPTRVAAQIVSGVGFLGAGVIFRDNSSQTNGLTTAATIWSTAAIGLAVAFNNYLIGVLTTLILIFLLVLNHIPAWKRFKRRNRRKNQQKSPKLD